MMIVLTMCFLPRIVVPDAELSVRAMNGSKTDIAGGVQVALPLRRSVVQ